MSHFFDHKMRRKGEPLPNAKDHLSRAGPNMCLKLSICASVEHFNSLGDDTRLGQGDSLRWPRNKDNSATRNTSIRNRLSKLPHSAID